MTKKNKYKKVSKLLKKVRSKLIDAWDILYSSELVDADNGLADPDYNDIVNSIDTALMHIRDAQDYVEPGSGN